MHSTQPDVAVSFGRKLHWFAFKDLEPSAVIEALGITEARTAGWSEGVAAAYEGQVFVTPPVEGWVLAASSSFLAFDGEDNELKTVVTELSEQLETTVQYFGTHRVVEYQAWAVADRGVLKRAYAYSGEAGEPLIDEGPRTADEAARVRNAHSPTEEEVLALAAKWSVDPSAFETAPRRLGTGWVGEL